MNHNQVRDMPSPEHAALCPDTLTDVGRGACFNDARVEVEKVATA